MVLDTRRATLQSSCRWGPVHPGGAQGRRRDRIGYGGRCLVGKAGSIQEDSFQLRTHSAGRRSLVGGTDCGMLAC